MRLHTLNAASPNTRAYIDYMMPTWKSNARRYSLNKRQTDLFIARMVSQTIRERDNLK